MSSEDTVAWSFWKNDAKQLFLSLRSVHSADGETHGLPRCECTFYRECRHSLKVFSRLQTGVSDSRPLSDRALYRCFVREAVSDDLIGELDVTAVEGRLLWPLAPGMRLLNNDEASLTWLVIRNALWVCKKLFSAQLATLPVCRLWVGWRSVRTTPSFTVLSCGRFLKVTCFASWMESSSSCEQFSICGGVGGPHTNNHLYLCKYFVHFSYVYICI